MISILNDPNPDVQVSYSDDRKTAYVEGSSYMIFMMFHTYERIAYDLYINGVLIQTITSGNGAYVTIADDETYPQWDRTCYENSSSRLGRIVSDSETPVTLSSRTAHVFKVGDIVHVTGKSTYSPISIDETYIIARKARGSV